MHHHRRNDSPFITVLATLVALPLLAIAIVVEGFSDLISKLRHRS